MANINITRKSFEEAIDALLNAHSQNSNKGKLLKEWFENSFNTSATVSHIKEDKQIGNRVAEQFKHKTPIVVFVCDKEVNRSTLINKIREATYVELSTVLVMSSDTPHVYETLLSNEENDFVNWAYSQLEITMVPLESLSDEAKQREHDFREYLVNIVGNKRENLDNSLAHLNRTFVKDILRQYTGKPFIYETTDTDVLELVLTKVRKTKADQDGNRNSSSRISRYINFLKNDMEMSSSKDVCDNMPCQLIFYGAPGTGKSYKINEITKSTKNFTRTTFHPDSDYSTFVGCYKPTMEPTGTIVGGKEQKKISYSYVAQAFLQAYTAAWKNTSEPYYLIIEEINRGNCAQIFGDLFQLLDRDEEGMSSYGITPDKDIANYLKNEFAKSEIENADIKSGNTMMLPSNLYILATMNTSDQSLFPIDSAFKRRWDWEYVPIEDAGKKHYIKVGNKKYDWWTFIDTINNSIDHITGSEDKKMGYWFVKPQNNDREITAKQFVGKVLFYLWNDVYKDYFDSSQSIFKIKKDDGTIEKKPFTYFFGSDADNRIIAFMNANGITDINLNNDEQVPEGLKQLEGSSSSDSSELQEWRKQYWAEIKELMRIKGLDFRTTPTTRNYYQMSIGVTGISLINSINRNSGECWSGIYIEKQQADEYYPKFKSVKDELDRQIPNLEWIHEDGKYASIRISKSFANILNSEIREESKGWFAETSVQFNNVFKPIVEQIFK